MDRFFDEVARILAGEMPRRRALKLLGSAFVAATLGTHASGQVDVECPGGCSAGLKCCPGSGGKGNFCVPQAMICCKDNACDPNNEICCGNLQCCGPHQCQDHGPDQKQCQVSL